MKDLMTLSLLDINILCNILCNVLCYVLCNVLCNALCNAFAGLPSNSVIIAIGLNKQTSSTSSSTSSLAQLCRKQHLRNALINLVPACIYLLEGNLQE